MPRTLPTSITQHTVLPVIAAPMFLVSGPELVLAACRAGIIGSFPTANARTPAILDQWMQQIKDALAEMPESPTQPVAPWAANLVVHRTNARLAEDLALVLRHQPPIVITALGSPAHVVGAIHDYGGLVLADVNSVAYARKAAATGVDGLILVSAGAGGHTGMLAGFAFVEAVREFWDGPLVLAGAIATGRAIRAAQVLGADLVYLGTRFIATHESLAQPEFRQMLVEATAEDIILTNAFTGIPANMLRPSIRRMGLDPDRLKPKRSIDFTDPQASTKAWKDIWSAGQAVGSTRAVQSLAEVVTELRHDYAAALRAERQDDPWTRLALDDGPTP